MNVSAEQAELYTHTTETHTRTLDTHIIRYIHSFILLQIHREMPKRKAIQVEGVDDRIKSVPESLLSLWERMPDKPSPATAMSVVFDTSNNSIDPDECATTLQYLLSLELYNGAKVNRTASVRVHFVAPPERTCTICCEAKVDSCVPLKSAVDRKKHHHHHHHHYDQVCAHPHTICSECMAKQSICPFCREPFECFAVFHNAGKEEKTSVVLQTLGGPAFKTQSLAKIFLQETDIETLDVTSLHGVFTMLLNPNSARKDIWKVRYAGMLSMESHRCIVELASRQQMLYVVRSQEKRIRQKLTRFHKAMTKETFQPYDELRSDFEFLAAVYGYTMEQARRFDARNLFTWRQVFPCVWKILDKLRMSLDRFSFQQQCIDLTKE